MKERLEKAVKSGQVIFSVPLFHGELATAKINVTKMTARGAFDYLCHPYTSSPLTPLTSSSESSTQHADSSTGEAALINVVISTRFGFLLMNYVRIMLKKKRCCAKSYTFTVTKL